MTGRAVAIFQEAVDQQVVSRLRRSEPRQQRGELLRDAQYTTDWIAQVIREIASKEEPALVHKGATHEMRVDAFPRRLLVPDLTGGRGGQSQSGGALARRRSR